MGKNNSNEIKTALWPLAVVDWGNTNLRVYLIGEDASKLEKFEQTIDIKTLNKSDFRIILDDIMEKWNHEYGCSKVILMGMVGSNFGWYDRSMLSAPLTWKILADNLFPIPEKMDYEALIIPGVSIISEDAPPDMMRGEETQVLGASTLENLSDGLFCLPGTHTKWVTTKDNAIVNIRTSVTGEIFALLREHSVLHLALTSKGEVESDIDWKAFDEGLSTSKSRLGALQLIFSVRACNLLLGCKPPSSARSYLSGLLIGCEVLDNLAVKKKSIGTIRIVGNEKLSVLYQRALISYEVSTQTINVTDSVITGAKWLYESSLSKKN